VGEVKYPGVVFTREGKRKKEIDKQSGKVNEVLLELYRFTFVPILTYGHEFREMTE